MENVATPTIITIVFLILTVIILTYSMYKGKEREDRLSRSIDRLLERYQTKTGSTSLFNGTMLNYNLQTFDGGKIWYACEYGKDWEVIILGKAEDVYPGLVKHLDAWDRLTKYVETHGAIGSKPITEEEKQMLKDANFKVEEKK